MWVCLKNQKKPILFFNYCEWDMDYEVIVFFFAGEWVAEWQVNGATKEEYQRFAKAQLNVFGRATFGWAYWTLRNVNNHWSLEWMIKNGYIKL